MPLGETPGKARANGERGKVKTLALARSDTRLCSLYLKYALLHIENISSTFVILLNEPVSHLSLPESQLVAVFNYEMLKVRYENYSMAIQIETVGNTQYKMDLVMEHSCSPRLKLAVNSERAKSNVMRKTF